MSMALKFGVAAAFLTMPIASAATGFQAAPAAAQPSAQPPSSDFMIFRSQGPSANRYRAGQRLPSNAKLVLRPGDSVIIVQDSRFARTFRGPGTYGLSMSGGSQTTAGITGAPRTTTGAVRGETDAERTDPSLSRFIICPQDRRCPR